MLRITSFGLAPRPEPRGVDVRVADEVQRVLPDLRGRAARRRRGSGLEQPRGTAPCRSPRAASHSRASGRRDGGRAAGEPLRVPVARRRTRRSRASRTRAVGERPPGPARLELDRDARACRRARHGAHSSTAPSRQAPARAVHLVACARGPNSAASRSTAWPASAGGHHQPPGMARAARVESAQPRAEREAAAPGRRSSQPASTRAAAARCDGQPAPSTATAQRRAVQSAARRSSSKRCGLEGAQRRGESPGASAATVRPVQLARALRRRGRSRPRSVSRPHAVTRDARRDLEADRGSRSAAPAQPQRRDAVIVAGG